MTHSSQDMMKKSVMKTDIHTQRKVLIIREMLRSYSNKNQ